MTQVSVAKLPSICVVIPSFNRAGIVGDAIRSALAQSYDIAEVIVVDDGSTDSTSDCVAAIADPRVTFIQLSNNVGQCAATNIGIKAAKSNLIATLDSDDIWSPFKIKNQVDLWLAAENPEMTIVYTQLSVDVGGSNRLVPRRAILPSNRVAEYLFCDGGVMQQSSLLMPAALLKEVLFDERNSQHSDVGLVLRLEQRGAAFVMANGPLTHWRTVAGPDRLTHQKDSSASLAWLELYSQILLRQEKIGFCARMLAPNIIAKRPLEALSYLAQGVISGSMSWIEACSIISRNYMPIAIDNPVRNLAYRLAALVNSKYKS